MDDYLEISIQEDFVNNKTVVNLSFPRRVWMDSLMKEPSDTSIMNRLIHLIEETNKEKNNEVEGRKPHS